MRRPKSNTGTQFEYYNNIFENEEERFAETFLTQLLKWFRIMQYF